MILDLLLLFIIGSTFGYILELFFRRFVSYKRWINPGFLVGPYIPLYGVSLVSLYLGCLLLDKIPISNIYIKEILIIVILTIIVTLIELFTGVLFSQVFHVKLWDYSNRKGNIMGAICPLFSFFWMILIAIYKLWINPLFIDMLNNINFNNVLIIFLMGMYYGIFLIDNIYSFHIVSKLKEKAIAIGVTIKYEQLKLNLMDKSKELKEKLRFLLPIKLTNNFKEKFDYYLSKIRKINKK